MLVTIELNQAVTKQYQAKAKAQDISLEQLLTKILHHGLIGPAQEL